MNSVSENQFKQAEDITCALYDFFSEKEKEELHPLLRKVLHQLVTLQMEKGRGFLTKDEMDEISETPDQLHAVGEENENCPLVLTKAGRLYFRKYFEYELSIARFLSDSTDSNDPSFIKRAVSSFEKNFIELVDDFQSLAVGLGIIRNWMLLCGGPGTGKTRTLVVLISLLLEIKPDFRIAMVAPTGKAAFRLQQSIDDTVKTLGFSEELVTRLSNLSRTSTIHRLLGVVPGSVNFRRNASNPLPYDLVVVDEASMIDLPLMAKLFNALVRGAEPNKFNQEDLPLLRKFSKVAEEITLPNSQTGHIVSLMKSHRHDSGNAGRNISNLCRLIKEGKGEEFVSSVHEGNQGIELITSLTDLRIQEILESEYTDFLRAENPMEAVQALMKFRVLCAHNQGKYGVEQWNIRAKSLFSLQESGFAPVVIQKNDYGVDLFNGDDGVVAGEKAFFESGEGIREISKVRLPSYADAFALSIHRSQGSEYDRIMIILPPPEAKLLSRELLYVAVSRAKKGIVFVGDPASLISAVNQEGEVQSGIVELME